MSLLVAISLLPILITACASSGGLSTQSTGTLDDGYTLTSNELEYDCKQLTGRMQIRILSIRDYNAENNTTLISHAMQKGTAATLGGTTAGANPTASYRRDRAMLEAYNRQLAAKGCKTYDLTAELQPKDYQNTPTASIRPAAGAEQ